MLIQKRIESAPGEGFCNLRNPLLIIRSVVVHEKKAVRPGSRVSDACVAGISYKISDLIDI